MVKRGISARGRGAPPLPRQRAALRIVQLTLVGLSLFLLNLAYLSFTGGAWNPAQGAMLALCGVVPLAGALWMGIRTVRGPQPPTLE